MSADAKVWLREGSNWWEGLHDGPCLSSPEHHRGGSYHLSEVVTDIEICMRGPLRWEFRSYPDDTIGLVGYVV